MDRINGVTESVLHTGQMAHTGAIDLQGHAKTLAGHILGLQGVTSGSWAIAMQTAHDNWQSGAARLAQYLINHGDQLNSAGQIYDVANEASQHGFNAAFGNDPFGGALAGGSAPDVRV